MMLLIAALLVPLVTATTIDPKDPQQIHLSLGRNLNEFVVTWNTYEACSGTSGDSLVRFGKPGKLDKQISGSCHLFVDGGPLKRKHYIHRVILSNLEPLTTYEYQCGSHGVWSKVISFKSVTDSSSWSPRLLVYGDLGVINGQSMPRIRKEVEAGEVDLIFHAGDFAYDMDTDNSKMGDEFMREMEPIASRVPYQTCPGNHEQKYNFSNYDNRFSMYDMRLGRMNNHFYAFPVGPALFISFSTEFYYFVNYGLSQLHNQYQWIEQTLIEANKPENRRERPWIITVGHRPMYCSNTDGDDCTHAESLIRKGLPIAHKFGLEDLFYKYGVDLELWAHEHSYERLWPVMDHQVHNGTSDAYHNPPAPVHIITGSAGCQEMLDHFKPTHNWSARRISDYGYARLHLINSTHLYMEQVSDDKQGTVLDSIHLVQEKHGMRKVQ